MTFGAAILSLMLAAAIYTVKAMLPTRGRSLSGLIVETSVFFRYRALPRFPGPIPDVPT